MGKWQNLKSVQTNLLSIQVFSLPAEPGSSSRLLFDRKSAIRCATLPRTEPHCAAVFNKTLARAGKGFKAKTFHREEPLVLFSVLLFNPKIDFQLS